MPFTGAQVAVGTSATSVLAPSTLGGAPGSSIKGPKSSVITNQGSASVFLGGSTVTTGNGYELKAGLSITVDISGGDTLYGVCASGTVRVDVLAVDK